VDTSRVEAMKLLTFTWAVGPKCMPLGLTKNRVPLAFRVPNISLGLEPITLLNTEACEEGCIKFTVSFWAILKLLKLITALSDAITFSVVEFGFSKVADPLSTCSPSGSANKLEHVENDMIKNTRLNLLNGFTFATFVACNK
jgi:hypothetical protein